MKPTLRKGLSRVERIVVDSDRTIGFMGEQGSVYGTPNLVRDIEHTCRDLLLEHADCGEDSVGMEIAVRHMAPTLLGMAVEIAATVTAGGRPPDFIRIPAKNGIQAIRAGGPTPFCVRV